MRTPRVLDFSLLVACAMALWCAGAAQAQSPSPALQATPQAEATGNKPNILVIWGDDIGQGNVSGFIKGLMGYRTPNIDRVANEGMIFCDVEKTVKHILKQLAIALKQGDELFSTGLKVDCVPLGRIEGRGDLLHQCGRHLKRLLEGFNLVGGNAAISLGHLGTQHDHITVKDTSLSGSAYSLRS